MGITRILVLFWALWAGGLQAGSIRYQVEGRTFEGYHLAGASQQSTLVLLVHDWDGLTGYEMKRADMLAALGYRVFAADLFGVGVRPTEVEDKKRLTGALYQDRASCGPCSPGRWPRPRGWEANRKRLLRSVTVSEEPPCWNWPAAGRVCTVQ